MGSRVRRLRATVAIVAVVVASCGADSGVVTGGDAPDGYQRVSAPAGFSMVLPGDWEVVDGADLDGEDVAAAIQAEFPELAGMTAELEAVAGQGVVLWAFDFGGSAPGFVDNINVIKAPRMGLSAESLQQMNLSQFEQFFGVRPRSSIRTSLQGYEVVSIEYSLTSLGTKGSGAIVLTDDTQWVVTLSVSPASEIDFDFDLLVDLFRET